MTRTRAPSGPRVWDALLRWLSAGVIIRLALAFVLLCAVGYGSALALTALTPGWADAEIDPATAEGISPRARSLDPEAGGVDAAVARWVAGWRTPQAAAAATFVAGLAKIWFVFPLIVVLGLLVLLRSGRADALVVAVLAVGGGLALSVAVKLAVFRPRPPDDVAAVEAFGPSYPSGHAIRALAALGALAWFAGRGSQKRWTRVAAWSTAVALALAVGVARVVEGAHWLTDILGSYLLGAGWLVAILIAGGYLAGPARSAATGDRP